MGLCFLAQKTTNICFLYQNQQSQEEVLKTYHRIMDGKPGKTGSDVIIAMQRAQEEINSLIDQYGDSFMDNAKNVLAEYCERAQHNIDTIQQLLASAENPTAVFK
jgi:hypothetical protein